MSRFLKASAAVLALCSAGTAHAQSDDAPWQEDLTAFLDVLHAEHDNPYFHTPRDEFEAAVAAYRAALPGMDRAERITGLARIIALVGDGHTWMPMHRLPFEGLPAGPGFSSLPVRFELFEDGLYVVGAGDAHSDLLGARVEAFGTVPVDQAIADALQLLPTDATNFAREFVAEWLMQFELLQALGLAGERVELRFADGRSVELQPLAPDALYNWVFSMDGGPAGQADWQTATDTAPFWQGTFDPAYRIVELDGATYLQFTEIRDWDGRGFAELAQAAVAQAEARQNPALIIDLRRCLGGDGSRNEGFIAALAESEAINREGRLMILTGRSTHSAAVMLVSALEQRTQAIFLGQGTADRPNHYGETNIFVTPNSLLPVIHASEYYQTSYEGDERRFRAPDIAIPYTFADYAAGTDAVLDAAINAINGD